MLPQPADGCVFCSLLQNLLILDHTGAVFFFSVFFFTESLIRFASWQIFIIQNLKVLSGCKIDRALKKKCQRAL